MVIHERLYNVVYRAFKNKPKYKFYVEKLCTRLCTRLCTKLYI